MATVNISNEGLRDYVIKLGAPAERTYVLRAGINARQFSPDSNNGSTLREHYGLSEEDVVLFFMGWLYNFSGIKEVALQLAQTNNDSTKLLIVGEGDAYTELQQIRERYNLEDKLILTGRRPYQEMPALIAAADICLLPAYPEEKIMQDIVPIKMYEYMAMGKTTVAPRLGPLEEVVTDGVHGRLFEPKNVNSLRNAIIDLIHDDKERNRLGQQAREHVLANHTWTHNAESVINAYWELHNGARHSEVRPTPVTTC